MYSGLLNRSVPCRVPALESGRDRRPPRRCGLERAHLSHSDLDHSRASGTDLNGDGTQGTSDPERRSIELNRGMDRSDLERLVAEFNRTYAGNAPALTLPARYSFGENFHSLDVRFSRTFVIQRRLRLSLIGRSLQSVHASNPIELSGDLTAAVFGAPGSRVRQVFGSGGPRSFQLAARVSF